MEKEFDMNLKDQPSLEETDKTTADYDWMDFLIDAAVVVGLATAAVLAAPVSVILAVALGAAALYAAYTTYGAEGNIFERPEDLVTTISIATIGAFGYSKILGTAATAIAASSLFGVLPEGWVSSIGDFVSSHLPMIMYVLLALLIWWANRRYRMAAEQDDEIAQAQTKPGK